jgi:hypothetical protein
MSEFPLEWAVFPLADFPQYEEAGMRDALGCQLLMAVHATELTSTEMRLHVFGTGGVSISLPAANILPGFMRTDTNLYVEAKAGDMAMGTNESATPWQDLDALIREGRVLVCHQDGTPKDPGTVLAYLMSIKADKHCSGASLRWAITATAARTLQIELQGMPTQVDTAIKRKKFVFALLTQTLFFFPSLSAFFPPLTRSWPTHPCLVAL